MRDSDDRAFLCELAREIIAAVAPEELGDFEELIAAYFADPAPPRHTRAQMAGRPGRLTPVAPAVLSAVMSLLALWIEREAQYDRVADIKAALKRLLRYEQMHSSELVEIRPGDRLSFAELRLVLRLYTRPVAVRVPLDLISHFAYKTARLYGLNEERANALVPLAVARLILGPSTFQESD